MMCAIYCTFVIYHMEVIGLIRWKLISGSDSRTDLFEDNIFVASSGEGEILTDGE